MRGLKLARFCVVAIAVAAFAVPVFAQTAPQTQPVAADEGEISFNFPDNVPLKTFVEYSASRLGLNIIYDEQILRQHLTIKSPAVVPQRALRPLLESVLKMNGLALADTDQANWKRIVALSSVAQPTTAPITGGTNVLTQVFRLHHADPQRIEALIKPLLTTPGGSSASISEQGLLVVTDFQSAIQRIAELVRLVDAPAQDVDIAFVPLKFADASQLAGQVTQLLSALRTKQGAAEGAENVSVAYDGRTNQVVVIGDKALVAQSRTMIASLDVPVNQERNPVRFYKLANTTASEVLATIQALENEDANGNPPNGPPNPLSPGNPRDTNTPANSAYTSPSANETGSQGSPAAAAANTSANHDLNNGASQNADTFTSGAGPAMDARGIGAAGGALPPSPNAGATSAAPASFHTKNAKIASDPHTNTIIIEADPSVQQMYEALIRQLDKRRPQVLIEATVVTLDTSHDFSLGVEISGHGGTTPGNQYLVFSSFGLSTVNPNGQLSIIPGVGFNGALISTDVADVVVRALEDNNHAKVSSAPRILVNDNSTGNLVSNQEQPFTANNFNNTLSTTSFGGYAEAGTEITVTPHISESDYLQLEYSVSLSNFTAAATQSGIPPPRQTNLVQSKVTIPDGSTIIVGGLNRQNYTRMVQSIPLLGDIPVVKYFFSNRTVADDKSTLFIFIRPIILRDDKFADLKFLSERDVQAAEMPGDYPKSEPLAVE